MCPRAEESRDSAESVGPRSGRQLGVAELIARCRAGDRRAVARLISLVEDEAPVLREVAAALSPYAGHAHVVGVTGAPGVGKSTATGALVNELRRLDRRVGVLAIDPSSPFTGGAVLGDRVRMQDHATDPGVYIRSMATRGHLGGLNWATPQAIRILDAAGYDLVLVETVGVGQSEVEVAGLADTTVVMLAPGMGDGIQATKAGILEIGDIYVVNKADRDGAPQVVRDLRTILNSAGSAAAGSVAVGSPGPATAGSVAVGSPGSAAVGSPGSAHEWHPILTTVAQTGEGIAALIAAVIEHRSRLAASGRLAERRLARARAEVEAIALVALRRSFAVLGERDDLDSLAAQVIAGRLDPYAAADRLIEDR